jgi:DNA processing protein
LDVCRDIVEQLVSSKITIVAGYAAGVDQTAHYTALKTGGETVAVLAEGILNFSIRHSLLEEWDWTRSLVVSQFLPQARWAVGKAMQRNRTIIGLGRALVVIEAKESGGTFEAGQSALALKKPLFAPAYESIESTAPGNQILISRGAKPIMKSRTVGRAKLEPLLDLALAPDAVAGRSPYT